MSRLYLMACQFFAVYQPEVPIFYFTFWPKPCTDHEVNIRTYEYLGLFNILKIAYFFQDDKQYESILEVIKNDDLRQYEKDR